MTEQMTSTAEVDEAFDELMQQIDDVLMKKEAAERRVNRTLALLDQWDREDEHFRSEDDEPLAMFVELRQALSE